MFKNIIVLILAIVLLVSFADAQQYNRGFVTAGTPDTLAGADTNLYAFPEKITKYSGVVSFTYLTTNIEDSCNNIIMQGSQDNTTWINVATEPSLITADSTMQDENPNYLYYRLFASTAAGDSVAFDAVNFVYKEE